MIRQIRVFIKRKIRKFFQEQYSKNDIELLGDKNFVIISDNCWGAEIYKWHKRPYNTPFVGLFLHSSCYLKLLSNFKYYMELELEFTNSSKYADIKVNYPVAKLDDVEIHFMHYKSEMEAREKWNRRTTRMFEETNLDNYYFKMCDYYVKDVDSFIKFHQLPFKNKISFGIKEYPSLKKKNHIVIKESSKDKMKVPNGVKLFKITFLYFNITRWLYN